MTKKNKNTSKNWIHLPTSQDNSVKLTEKQQTVFDYIKNGYRAEEIAFEMGCSKAAIRKHEIAIRQKLGARTNAHAVLIMFLG